MLHWGFFLGGGLGWIGLLGLGWLILIGLFRMSGWFRLARLRCLVWVGSFDSIIIWRCTDDRFCCRSCRSFLSGIKPATSWSGQYSSEWTTNAPLDAGLLEYYRQLRRIVVEFRKNDECHKSCRKLIYFTLFYVCLHMFLTTGTQTFKST